MITREEVLKAAKLSRLALSEPELARLADDLQRITGYVEQLSTVDVEGIEPMVQPFDLEGARREDTAAPVMGRKAIEGSAGYQDGLVRVPQVVD